MTGWDWNESNVANIILIGQFILDPLIQNYKKYLI